MKFNAKIKYTMDENHPDRKYVVGGWNENKVMEFSDVYTIASDSEDDCVAYIKRDLKLVAGGGYNADHIHNVAFEIERIDEE